MEKYFFKTNNLKGFVNGLNNPVKASDFLKDLETLLLKYEIEQIKNGSIGYKGRQFGITGSDITFIKEETK